MKAHIQQENEELLLNDSESTNITNEEIVQLPINNQTRLVIRSLEIKTNFSFFFSPVNRKRRKRNNDEIIERFFHRMRNRKKIHKKKNKFPLNRYQQLRKRSHQLLMKYEFHY
jgi:hypothetical protein